MRGPWPSAARPLALPGMWRAAASSGRTCGHAAGPGLSKALRLRSYYLLSSTGGVPSRRAHF